MISRFNKIFFLIAVVYLFGFTFYSGDTPEYYFTGLIPLIVLCFSILISQVIKVSGKLKILMTAFSAVLLFRSYITVSQINPQSLGAKENVIRKIKEKTVISPVKIIYDMDLGWSYGYKYLLDYYSVQVNEQEKNNVYWISFPNKRFPLVPDFVSGELALGNPETTKNIYNSKQVEFYDGLFKLRLEKDWILLQCPGIDFDRYLLTDNLNASCNTLNNEIRGILIENVPGCNIWETSGLKPLETKSRIPVYTIMADNVKAFAGRNLKELVVLSFERNRCIGFIDLSTASSSESAVLPELLLSFKK